ncbi:MAG: TolC family protein, partial [Spongiibacteraceae bacterium]
FTLNMPLFAGGAVSAGRRQAEQQYQAADHNVTLVQRQVITSTRAQHIAVNTDIQVIKARKQSIKSATSALNASQAGYDVGTRNVVDVLDAQRKLYAAVRDHSNARYDYVVNVLKLKQNAGTLSPGDIASLSNWLESSK